MYFEASPPVARQRYAPSCFQLSEHNTYTHIHTNTLMEKTVFSQMQIYLQKLFLPIVETVFYILMQFLLFTPSQVLSLPRKLAENSAHT